MGHGYTKKILNHAIIKLSSTLFDFFREQVFGLILFMQLVYYHYLFNYGTVINYVKKYTGCTCIILVFVIQGDS